VLTDIDGTAVRTGPAATRRVAAHRPGDALNLRVLRNRRPIELTTKVIEQPRGR
jgi:hypothetical protein